jgi:phosphatidylserine decarboxylase
LEPGCAFELFLLNAERGPLFHMTKPLPLPVLDRNAGKLVEEFLDDHPTTYESEPQRSLTQWLESQPAYDWLVAALQHAPWTRRKIEPFVRKHHIDMSEFEPVRYRSYAHFFGRKFKQGIRQFPTDPNVMGAFAEARYFGWRAVEPDMNFPIKGHSLSPETILGSTARAASFRGGPVILARLAPVDYHRVHYPDDGSTGERDRLGERNWTVNQHALRSKPDILFKNERSISILHTAHFGRMAFVEIGALTVGRVVQTHPIDRPFRRGEEKSYFAFGGSAIMVFGTPGKWLPDDDILAQTREGIETIVRLGQPVARVSTQRRTRQ